jgi:hypothetical protein
MGARLLRWGILLLALFAWGLNAAPVSLDRTERGKAAVERLLAAYGSGDRETIDAVLASGGRWDVPSGLEAWDRDLTGPERRALNAFAADNERRDWLLQYRAHSVLRRYGGETRVVAPEVDQAGAILAQLNDSKIPRDHYDPRALDIVALGSATCRFCSTCWPITATATSTGSAWPSGRSPDCRTSGSCRR